MTSQDPRAGGSHRRVDRGRRLRVLLVSLVVVVLAAAGVEAALHWRGESKRPAANAASSHYVSPSATPSGSTPSTSTSVQPGVVRRNVDRPCAVVLPGCFTSVD